jgi:hypothetical protein
MKINYNLMNEWEGKARAYSLQKELLTYLLQDVVEEEIVRVGHSL